MRNGRRTFDLRLGEGITVTVAETRRSEVGARFFEQPAGSGDPITEVRLAKIDRRERDLSDRLRHGTNRRQKQKNEQRQASKYTHRTTTAPCPNVVPLTSHFPVLLSRASCYRLDPHSPFNVRGRSLDEALAVHFDLHFRRVKAEKADEHVSLAEGVGKCPRRVLDRVLSDRQVPVLAVSLVWAL